MILIHKQTTEPMAFQEAKRLHATYDDLHSDEKDPLKSILIEDQHRLCAYCMAQIRMNNSSIEHIIPRHPSEPQETDTSLDYHNLLAVCVTSRNLPESQKYCEAKRGNKEIHINPTTKEHMDTITYDSSGKIYSSNPEFQKDIDETLNLNCDLLCKNRKSAWNSALEAMNKKKAGKWSKEFLFRELDRIESKGTIPYIGYITFFLKKRLARC